MGRRVAGRPHDPGPAAYEAWRARWEGEFRRRGFSEEAVQRKVGSLLVSHVAWDRGPGPVTEHALAIGAVDLVLLEQHRAALVRVADGGGPG